VVRNLWQEFKAFAFKGNLIDLAVAVIIGAAFGAVVNSLVKNIFMPLLSYVIPTQGGWTAWHVGRIQIGPFLGELLNFVAVAVAVFVAIVKILGAVQKAAFKQPAAAGAPTTKECPYCLSLIPVKASRCAHCTSDQPALPATPPAA
jgi:large conductance mechanosensitive channel